MGHALSHPAAAPGLCKGCGNGQFRGRGPAARHLAALGEQPHPKPGEGARRVRCSCASPAAGRSSTTAAASFFFMPARSWRAPRSSSKATRKASGAQSLSIVCQRSLANTVMREPLARFAREHRDDIRMAVRIAFQEEVIANIRSGTADVGYLVSNAPIAGVTSQLIGRLRFVVFAPPSHPLATRKTNSAGGARRIRVRRSARALDVRSHRRRRCCRPSASSR